MPTIGVIHLLWVGRKGGRPDWVFDGESIYCEVSIFAYTEWVQVYNHVEWQALVCKNDACRLFALIQDK